MNGIEFIVRDRAGWAPRIPLPRCRIPAEEIRHVRTMQAKKSGVYMKKTELSTPQCDSSTGEFFVCPQTVVARGAMHYEYPPRQALITYRQLRLRPAWLATPPIHAPPVQCGLGNSPIPEPSSP